MQPNKYPRISSCESFKCAQASAHNSMQRIIISIYYDYDYILATIVRIKRPIPAHIECERVSCSQREKLRERTYCCCCRPCAPKIPRKPPNLVWCWQAGQMCVGARRQKGGECPPDVVSIRFHYCRYFGSVREYPSRKDGCFQIMPFRFGCRWAR